MGRSGTQVAPCLQLRLRRPAAWIAVLFAVGAFLLAGAPPAGAHATLIETDPAEGAVLPAAPEEVRFSFNEPISGVPDGTQVFDATGAEIASSAKVSGSDLTVTLDEEVGDGTLVVVWRAVSNDGHPISGSLSFSVGAPSDVVAEVPGEAAVNEGAPWPLSLLRWIGYIGLFVAAGLTAFVVLFLPADRQTADARRRLVVPARFAAVAAAAAWLATLPFVALYQLGLTASALTDGSTWGALPMGEYVVTGAVVIGVPVAVVLLGDGRRTGARANAAVVVAALATVAPAFVGHTRATTPEALVIAADMLHLLAGSVWLGGLVGLTLVLPDLAGRGELGGQVLARFSGIAAGLLAVLVVTGTLLGWRIVETWTALFDTGYGQLLLVKILVAVIAVAIAAWNRFGLLPRLREATRRRERRAGAGLLARATGAEAGVLVAVLLVTGFLVDRSPEEEASVAPVAVAPEVQSTTLGDAEVRATVAPPTTGPSDLTVEIFDSEGRPYEGYDAPTVQLTSDAVDLGAITLENRGPGVYAAEVVFPTAGTWTLQVSLRLTEFENPVANLDFSIEAGSG